jgi:hypothetical protein
MKTNNTTKITYTTLLGGMLLSGFPHITLAAPPVWSGYGGNAQHTSVSPVATQSMQGIRWQTPVDLLPQYTGSSLLIHYGSPMVTAANTVIVPVKTGATDGFRVEARSGANGSLMWQFASDYSLPPSGWTPSYSPTITANNRLFIPGAGGTLFYTDNIDTATPTTPTRVAFFGDANYSANTAAFNAGVKVCTPLTTDAQGNVYFGYRTSGTNPLGITSGLARIGADGSTSFVTAAAATAGAPGGGATQVAMNCAPAISNDGNTVYVAMNGGSQGYMVSLKAETLETKATLALKDPKVPTNPAIIQELSTASPVVAPDGKVFFGVFENYGTFTSKGWMLQMNADLTQTAAMANTPGAFGWDISPTIVPASAVPSYTGTSSYLIMTKYNNYVSTGGDGVNKLAILDPNDTQIDARTGQQVMKEILTIAGVTPDAEYPGSPGAVREWCINSAAFDAGSGSIIANSEDGRVYRWDLATNTFTQSVTLTVGIGEAYTPTIIGADGAVYAINNATLFSVGVIPEPGTLALLGLGTLALALRRRPRSLK